ncbi:malto-oligosyltrehalose synthase [Arundinibacter roseus]|uniref:4-alpha-glucanotransferase n=2 Tax=Arundinibacter roseus TaxID=2070510 RepID=A0A4R4KBH2_9BACT|nr:malto-oligosyltrehalose synthase [Arundinibacter roseus]
MYNPITTYRIQFHQGFSFSDFEKILPYLHQLGVKTIYASPILESTPGSTHGYDAVNPHEIDPELGDMEALMHLKNTLNSLDMGWLQDIVPNHMAFDPSNPWLMDVLEKGTQSTYAPFFDIAWNSPLHQGSIMVPFLGAPLEEILERQELRLHYDGDRLVFTYQENSYPLNPASYARLLQREGLELPANETMRQFCEQVEKLDQLEDRKSYALAWDELRQQWAALFKTFETKEFIESRLKEINADPDKLLEVSTQQSYRLCDWQETDNTINFRRFFTINGLICLNIQNDEVFQHYHSLIKTLIDAGAIQGLRVDHIDGLYNPSDYLEQLRELAGDDLFICVEKILEPGENLPAQWPIQGTTGYDFMAQMTNLFTNTESENAFTLFYNQLVHEPMSLTQLQREKKEHILFEHMGGELENLYQLFVRLNLIDKRLFAAIHKDDMKSAIGEFLIQCPVYRYYGNRFPLDPEETAALEKLLFRVRRYDPDLHQAVGILEDIFLRKPYEGDAARNRRTAHFYQRCMQFAGPLMAKGVEDTLMYTYNRFIGHNEVGNSPEIFGITPDEFHQHMQLRQSHWPLALNSTATHDTKRGEDVRARLNVLTDLPDEWLSLVKEWQAMNDPLKDAEEGPDENDEYFIYQTLAGAYPMPGDDDGVQTFAERMDEYLEKVLREAKTYSTWAEPDEAYEAATKNFTHALLDPHRPFFASFSTFHKKISDHGIVNSLAQVILKCTAPGVPDLYQGCELWDLSLVDPDNRRPVDYEKRQTWLSEFAMQENTPALLEELWQNRYDGRLKLWLHQQLFTIRQQLPELFLHGSYLPLTVEGAYKNNVVAYLRHHHRHTYLVAFPIHTAGLCESQNRDISTLDWQDTRLILPDDYTNNWESIALPKTGFSEKELSVQSIFAPLPFAVMKAVPARKERSAGVLLHISSLPSAFGIGDLGPEAFAFADFLERSRQHFWQLLPINPVEEQQGYSPYSSTSSRAGNPLLISPEILTKEGLLTKQALQKNTLPKENSIAFSEVKRVRDLLFAQAWETFCKRQQTIPDPRFDEFCDHNTDWLPDFASYTLLKERFKGKAWFEWPEEYRHRDPAALAQLEAEAAPEIRKIMWLQYVFFKQWKNLKEYCNKREIELLGDLPIYVSYDSADVWAHRSIFHLDEEGILSGVAGVPPDAFSDDGQLWGMPVYRWDVLKASNYDWWMDRLKKNMELFDLIRLDHFRGFSSYWEVPAGEKTAVNGTWVEGPGADFFQTAENTFGKLPFVAEDLGDINAAVLSLRDQFELPGMKVLHFAFSDNMPSNEYIPHGHAPNFIVYTGTHDNNTSVGWYTNEADTATRRRLEQYTGHTIDETNVHTVLARLAYASVAKIAILPIQDLLGLGAEARTNTPASASGNWTWRLKPGQIRETIEKQLKEWTWIYNR